MALAALGMLLVAGTAAVQAADLQARKIEALASAGHSAEPALLAAAENAAALLSVEKSSNATGSEFKVLLSEIPEVVIQSHDAGRHISIELNNAIPLQETNLVLKDHPWLQSLNASLFVASPECKTRVNLIAALPCRADRSDDPNGFTITLTPRDRGLAASKAQTASAEPVRIRFEKTSEQTNTVLPATIQSERDLVAELAAELRLAVESDPKATSALTDRPEFQGLVADLASLESAAPANQELRLDTPRFSISVAANSQDAPDPVKQRIERLARSLEAVSDVRLELTSAPLLPPFAALQDSAATEGELGAKPPAEPAPSPAPEQPPAEQPAAPAAQEAATEEPEPPAKRVPVVVDTTAANAELTAQMRNIEPPATPSAPAPAEKPWTGNPLDRPVNLDFREMDLSNVVALLAHMAGINIIAGTDLGGTVTASLKNVPLRQAIDTTLRMNGLGIVEEEGIYRIVPYDEAIATRRTTIMVTLNNAKAAEVLKVLKDLIKGLPDEPYFNLSANDTANVLVIAGPEKRVGMLVDTAHQLDVAEPVLPTVTVPIKLNYSEPDDIMPTVEKMLTPTVGKVAGDKRARHLVVTDVPIVVEQVRTLVAELDVPVKSVALDAMLVDAKLNDAAKTGVDWILDSVRKQSRRDAATGGPMIGNLQQLALETNLAQGPSAGLLNFGILSNKIDWRGIIQAEVSNFNGKLVSNPVLVTSENQPATIEITQEVPYVEVQETQQGGRLTNTQFKNIGTVLEVTPRVTHDDNIITTIKAKESSTAGEFNGIPIEDLRQVSTTLHLHDGQTIFIGGLRKNNDSTTVRKVPVLGDVPVVNVLFRKNDKTNAVNELLIFLTCHVVKDEQKMTAYQAQTHEDASAMPSKPDSQNELMHETLFPGKYNDPIWKWRRPQ
jgi:type IV pilus assembly protein PilQ